jgi:tetratricopeptide (TPR) repeat protein
MKKNDNVEFAEIIELYKSGNYLAAKKKCEKLFIKYKKNVKIIHLLAKVELLANNSQTAIELMNSALVMDPVNIGVLQDLGNVYRDVGKSVESIECFQKIIKIAPSNAAAYHNCATTLVKMKKYDLAIDLYSNAYHIDNNLVISLVAIGKIYDLKNNFEMAISIYEKALVKDPVNADALLCLSDLYRKILKYDESLVLAERAVTLFPKNIKAYLVRGTIKKDLNLLNDAISDFSKALELDSYSEIAKNNKGMTLLMMGDYKSGWQLYESRWAVDSFGSKKYLSDKPLWNGERQGTLLIWPEQGIGDEIMFGSMISDAAKHVEKLVVLIDKRLIELFKRSHDSSINFVSSREESEALGYDFHIPIGSLGMFFRKSEDEFPKNIHHYLKPDASRVTAIEKLIHKNKEDKLIGVSWKSNNPHNGLKRGVELKEFLEKINKPNFKFINLQYGPVQEDIDYLKSNSNFEIINLQEIDNFKDIDGLAALIRACDEVISIDNSTIHLSGALGVKTSVMLQRSPDWRWLVNRNDTPWYQSVKLIRNAIN